MFMIVYRNRYARLNVEGHQDEVKSEILDDSFVERVAKNNSSNNGSWDFPN